MIKFLGRNDAKVLVLGEWPTKSDLYTLQPFSGGHGDFIKKMLIKAGISPVECVFGYAYDSIPLRLMGEFFEKPDKYLIQTQKFYEAQEKLKSIIIQYRFNVVIALGSLPFIMLTGEKLTGFRGTTMESTLVPGLKVVGSYNPIALYKDWKLKPILEKDLEKANNNKNFSNIIRTEYNFELNPTVEKIEAYIEFLLTDKNVGTITCDIETIIESKKVEDSNDFGPHISWLGFTHRKDYSMCIKLLESSAPRFNENDEIRIWRALSNLFSSHLEFNFQNGAYDVSVIYKVMRILVKNFTFDTMIAGHAIWPQLPKSLGFLSSICLDIPPWKHMSSTDMGTYNALDVVITHTLMEHFIAELPKQHAQNIFDLEMSELPVAIMLNLQGMPLDVGRKDELISKTSQEILVVESKLDAFTGDLKVNFGSPKQVATFLYQSLHLPAQYKRRKSATEPRVFTTDEKAMKKLQRKTKHAIIELIISYRKLKKLKSTFQNLQPTERGTVHTNYNVYGQKSENADKDDESSNSMGRWSSSHTIIFPRKNSAGNMQSVTKKARVIFVPFKDG